MGEYRRYVYGIGPMWVRSLIRNVHWDTFEGRYPMVKYLKSTRGSGISPMITYMK